MARASVASLALLSSDVPGLPASATQRCRRAASVSSRAVANSLHVSMRPPLIRVTGCCGDIAAGARVKRVIRRACLAAVVCFFSRRTVARWVRVELGASLASLTESMRPEELGDLIVGYLDRECSLRPPHSPALSPAGRRCSARSGEGGCVRPQVEACCIARGV